MDPNFATDLEWLLDDMSQYAFGPDYERIFALYIAFFAIALGVALLFCIASYVLNGIALTKMGKKRGVAYPWLAWIPFAGKYAFGKISETPDKPRKTGLVLLILSIAQCVSGLILGFASGGLISVAVRLDDGASEMDLIFPLIMLAVGYLAVFGVGIALSIIYYMAFYRIAKLFGGSQYLTYFLLGFIPVFLGFSIALYIALLVLSTREPDESSFQPQTPEQIWRNPLPGEQNDEPQA